MRDREKGFGGKNCQNNSGENHDTAKSKILVNSNALYLTPNVKQRNKGCLLSCEVKIAKAYLLFYYFF